MKGFILTKIMASMGPVNAHINPFSVDNQQLQEIYYFMTLRQGFALKAMIRGYNQIRS